MLMLRVLSFQGLEFVCTFTRSNLNIRITFWFQPSVLRFALQTAKSTIQKLEQKLLNCHKTSTKRPNEPQRSGMVSLVASNFIGHYFNDFWHFSFSNVTVGSYSNIQYRTDHVASLGLNFSSISHLVEVLRLLIDFAKFCYVFFAVLSANLKNGQPDQQVIQIFQFPPKFLAANCTVLSRKIPVA